MPHGMLQAHWPGMAPLPLWSAVAAQAFADRTHPQLLWVESLKGHRASWNHGLPWEDYVDSHLRC
jgi:hypothetical protein